MTLITTILMLLAGCDAGAPFTEIQQISIRHIGANGLVKRDLDSDELARAQTCLVTQTRLIEPEAALTELLPTTYLIEVKDKGGIRSFELYTQENLKGNKGRYYQNGCIFSFADNPPEEKRK